MAIQEFTRNLNDLDVTQEFINKNLHIVCASTGNGLTVYGALATIKGGVTDLEAEENSRKVNDLNETGTLWPRRAITFIPLTKYNERDDSGNKEIMRKHIQDAFLAQKRYLKSKEMVFVFEEREDFDRALAKQVLLEESESFDAPTKLYYLDF